MNKLNNHNVAKACLKCELEPDKEWVVQLLKNLILCLCTLNLHDNANSQVAQRLKNARTSHAAT